MKALIFLLSFFLATTGVSFAQSNVVDSHPEVTIFVIDLSTGQKVRVNYDTANLFKDAFTDLVLNTDIAQRESTRRFPGEKNFVIEQLDPQTNGNAYKFELLSRDRNYNQTFTIYTFAYNADNNTLTFLDQRYQRYVPVQVGGPNLTNLNNCYSYGLFNSQGGDNSASAPVDSAVDVNVSAEVAPPDMPEYQQPECPSDGYLWQPGYWGYNPRVNVYYWVPGAWVAPPSSGVVWTPPYWGYEGRVYVFHAGYWGEHVGFYGGINYGYGYGGHGFYGGEWRDNHFHYNTAVTRVNTTVVHNTYVNTTVINNTTIVNNTTINNHASFNGAGGVVVKPTQTEMEVRHEQHVMPTPEQNRNQQLARNDKSQFVAPGSNAKPANVAVERVPVRPVNNNPGQRPGFQGNNNQRPAMNQPGNQNGGRVGVTPPANNAGNRPAMNDPANQSGGTRPNMNEPANGNGNNKPAFNEPANNTGNKPAMNEPANNNGNRPNMNQPANPNGGRVGVTPPANTPANPNTTNPAVNQNARPNTPPANGNNPNNGAQQQHPASANPAPNGQNPAVAPANNNNNKNQRNNKPNPNQNQPHKKLEKADQPQKN